MRSPVSEMKHTDGRCNWRESAESEHIVLQMLSAYQEANVSETDTSAHARTHIWTPVTFLYHPALSNGETSRSRDNVATAKRHM